MKVAIVDDHKLFRRSLNYLLASFEGIQVAFEAKDGKELLELLKTYSVELVLLDIEMPGMDGYRTCKALRKDFPAIKVLIVSQLTTKESIHTVMELGAHGFFSKNADPENLRNAILAIEEKDFYFDQQLGSVVREAMLQEKIAITAQGNISKRELEVLKLACKEYSSKEIADNLNIDVRTVEGHRSRLMKKTDSKNFLGVILYALKAGYIQVEEL